MKILFISMPSIHAIRWIESLENTPFELYWFDIMDRGNILISKKVELKKIIDWKKRKHKYLKGEYWLAKNIPFLFEKIQPYLEVTIAEKLEIIIKKIQPNLIHSFEMQHCSYPILKTMMQYNTVKWLYSCWGSDLFYYKQFKQHNQQIKNVLKRLDYLHTDCDRDFKIAKQLGFKGGHIGVIPGGAGFNIKNFEKYKVPINERKIILIKGYTHVFGRAIHVLKALLKVNKNVLKDFQIVVFGAHTTTVNYITENNLKYTYYKKDALSHDAVMRLMGKAKIYIGNNISDGMSNTLLEAIVMSAYPIQSNPGNVTAEIITNNVNGTLISNPEDVDEIKTKIEQVIKKTDEAFFNAAKLNRKLTLQRLSFDVNKQKIVEAYTTILKAG